MSERIDDGREEPEMSVPALRSRASRPTARATRRPATGRVVTPLSAAEPGPDRPATRRRAAEPGPDRRATGRRNGRAALRRRSTWVAVVVLLVALGVLGWTGVRWRDADRLDSARRAALGAAQEETVNFVTINASSADADLQRIVDGATGDFKAEFTSGMPQVRQAVVENQVESTGQVLRAGLVSGDLDSAMVLVAVDASVKNVGAPDGRLSHYRVQVDLVLDPGSHRWLVSKLQFVG
jgi:Mce-associated membrane protein